MTGVLTKIESCHDIMPELTPVWFDELPEIGERFQWREHEEDWRYSGTTRVQSIKASDRVGEVHFRTRNSTYKLTYEVEL